MDLPLNRSKVKQNHVDGLGTVRIPRMGMACSMGVLVLASSSSAGEEDRHIVGGL